MNLIAYREVCADLLKGLDELKHPQYQFPGYITAAMDRARELLAQPAPAELATITPAPFSEQDLCEAWNSQADHANDWDSLDTSEQLAWAQACAIAAYRAAPPAEGEVGELVTLFTVGGDCGGGAKLSPEQCRRAAALLQQQAAAHPAPAEPVELTYKELIDAALAEPADHIRNGTEMVAPPAEGEVAELVSERLPDLRQNLEKIIRSSRAYDGYSAMTPVELADRIIDAVVFWYPSTLGSQPTTDTRETPHD